MGKTDTGRFSITRLLAIAVMLLLIPLSALAAGTDSPVHAAPSHGVSGDHHAGISPDSTVEVDRDAPSEGPLHCHLRTLHPPESGLAQTAVEGDLPLHGSHYVSAPSREMEILLPAIAARIPIPASPRFILFGNFRS